MLIEKHKDKIATILKRYPEKRAALLPLLWLSQEEQGYLSEAEIKEIAELLGLTPPQVYETVTFYTMLNRQPIGKHHIQVCRSLMCALVGTEQLLGWIHAKLGIKPGRSEEHTSELQSRSDLVCRLLLEKKKITDDILLHVTMA